MVDRDLAALYGVTTGNLNKAVQRNPDRFPPDFMFQLTADEAETLRFQLGSLKRGFTAEQRRIIWNTSSLRSCSHPRCNVKLTWDDFTIDHINPHSKGGRTQLANAALMCRKHNSKKGNRRR